MNFALTTKRRAALESQIADACGSLEDNDIFDAMDMLGFGSARLARTMKQVDLELSDLQLVAASAALLALANYVNRPVSKGFGVEIVE